MAIQCPICSEHLVIKSLKNHGYNDLGHCHKCDSVWWIYDGKAIALGEASVESDPILICRGKARDTEDTDSPFSE